ncbi:MAG: hypothetical protein ABIZ09_09870, partial [Rhodoferax sp.]
MLDRFTNQGAGLIGLGCQLGPRLVAMVSHGDEQAELPLLWQLCLSLVNFGYSVTVLDATTEESEANPGLKQLLKNAHSGEDSLRDSSAWTVLASAQGLQSLIRNVQTQSRSLQQLGPLMPAEGIVVLYCKVDWMTELIGDQFAEPLLAVSPNRKSLLTGYIALKRLLITGKLKPTIVNMDQEPNRLGSAGLPTASAGLGECAKRFLGRELKTLHITDQQPDIAPCE